MTNTLKPNQQQTERFLTLLNPYSDLFDFELWSSEVRQQMLTTLQKRLTSHQSRLSQ